MTQKYISVIKLKKQIVTGAMGLLPTTGICWYANMAAMARNQKLYFIKSDKVQAVEKLSWKKLCG